MTPELRKILDVGLSIRPSNRFPNMDALVRALDNLLRGEVPAADAARVQPPEPPRPRRRVFQLVAVAALCVTCTLGGAEVSERTGFSPSRILTPSDPLTRAEAAAKAGDGETAIAELNKIAARSQKMSLKEFDHLIHVTEQIAEILAPTSPDAADEARVHAELLRRQRGRR